MPRNYTRKTTILSYTPEDLQNALDAIRNNGQKIRAAGRSFNIPESTLRKKLEENDFKLPRLGRKPVFPQETEAELKDYVLLLSKLFYGLTPVGLRRLAFRYAELHNITHNFNQEKGLAGKAWLYGFLNRFPEIKLRQPEGTSLNRIASFNKEAVGAFYSNLQVLMQKFKFEANRVFNVDETSITTVQAKCPKVYGAKGAKKVGSAISGERGRTITGVFCISAAGNYIPPMLIYPRKRMPATLQKNGPVGALYKCSKNGWINSDLFCEWLTHLAKHAKPTTTDPILLVLDNHASHISIRAYNFCKQNNIHMVSLPPHTSDHLQPLDLTVFSPLKNALYREYDLYLSTTGHQKITEYDVAELLNKAFMKIATMEKCVSGFRTSGIYPLDPDKFNDDDFAPANEAKNLAIECSSDQDEPNIPKSDVVLPDTSQSCSIDYQDPQPSTSKENSFLAMAPIPKKKVDKKVTRKSREKQCSKILTSTPVREELEAAEEKKRLREENLKRKEKEKMAKKKTVRRCFSDETLGTKKFKGKQKLKKETTPESSDDSMDEDLSDICNDDELDDVELSFIPPSVKKPSEPNDTCGICGESGKDKELWFRCVLCSLWNHAECTSAETPENYKCDYCS